MPIRVATPIPIPRLGRSVGAGSQILKIPWVAQSQTLWCWAACCEMVFGFHGTSVTQCQLASWALSIANCCITPLPAGCNRTLFTTHPTNRDIKDVYANWSRGCAHRFGQVSFASVQAEIGANRPLEVCYAWTRGGAHVAIVNGWQVDASGAEFVLVRDPANARHATIRFSFLRSAYGLGSWVETFTGLN